MHQYRGKLIVHTGSMFSGKTSSLEKDVKRFNIAKYKTLAFKPAIDNRYKKNAIVTHDLTSINAILVNDIDEIIEYCNELEPDVIAIDEIQFLGGLVENIVSGINSLLEKGLTVIVAGLDIDFTGTPFEIVKELMPIADYLYKHHAVCVRCGNDGWVSHRKSKDMERIKIGATDEYEPLCRKCFLEAREESGFNK
ncbi:thymidine kinase [Tepidimicrobium xylanilyticum]|uniref:Thymidine kinase n=1 Tax=Tepidimicrobium xylanilyticum TaxID=1123352 RepID=A0A1H2Z7K4_9FIRM|nr:thymidine kinase [Tepidimicrobium xylanilyticum]GMG96404.1 thymidine kinase [Tepidimicrobium xylanilyticum]SDX13321.1 thymidine kinase [Tepidimicrobium xylanilyticum]